MGEEGNKGLLEEKIVVFTYDPNYKVKVKVIEKTKTLYIYFKHRKTDYTLASVRLKGVV